MTDRPTVFLIETVATLSIILDCYATDKDYTWNKTVCQ
jgi:hypothetical protein